MPLQDEFVVDLADEADEADEMAAIDPDEIDLQALAEEVYALLRRELKLENERRGVGPGR